MTLNETKRNIAHCDCNNTSSNNTIITKIILSFIDIYDFIDNPDDTIKSLDCMSFS